MNLMIVEDEPRLRNALAFNIPWDEHNIEVVGLASSGLEALELVSRKKPDIMLLDIQMPEMDGLTLLRELKERRELDRLKLIILSGHDNFTFAQHALEFGVSKYLLKPAGESEVLEAVLEARTQLRADLEQWQRRALLERRWKDNLPHLQHLFFIQWVGGKFTEQEVLCKSKELYIPLKGEDRIAIAVVDLDPIPKEETRFRQGDRELLQFTVQCLAQELLPAPACWVCTDSDNLLLLIFILNEKRNPKDEMLRVHAEAAKLLSQTKEVLKLTASAGICASTGTISEAALLYSQACRALQERVIYGHDLAIPYREQQARDNQGIAVQQSLEKALEIALETADEAKALKLLGDLWEEVFTSSASPDEFHEAILYVSGFLIRVIHKQGWTVKKVVGEDIAYFHNVRLLSTKMQTWSLLERTVRHIVTFMSEQRKTSSNQLVKDILHLLEEEMDKEITLHTVADRLYVNSSYLSRLFKQEVGVAFSAYVLRRKMERAKSLLQQGQKVYDTARLVGYRDVSYFTKVFRKYWGVNPGEFKG